MSVVTATPPSFSNLVVKSEHHANLNPTVLFELAPVVKYDRAIFDESKKKVPYFGHEGIFVSIRNNGKTRGLRPTMRVKSFSDLDIQFLGKNFHVKVSKRSVNIVGGVNMETSRRVCELLYSFFERIEGIWSEIRKLETRVILDTMSWYRKMAKERVELVKMNNNLKFNAPVDWTDFPESCDFELASWLEILIDEKYDNIDRRIADIQSCISIPLYDKKPELDKLYICNSVYDYRLPGKISLSEKAHALVEKGYTVMFHNWAVVKCIKAAWTVDTGKVDKDGEPVLKYFRFSIQNVGTVKQNSSFGEEESIAMYEKLVTDLGFTPYYVGANYAVKTSSPVSELPEKNYGTVEILRRAFAL